MPQFGYDYNIEGVLVPFEITSIMGGGMYLLPSPDSPDSWKTWGFNPYDAGGDYYSVTSDIAVEGVGMRIPEFQVNLPQQAGMKDYGRYLLESVRIAREALVKHIDGMNLDTVFDPAYVAKLPKIANQLAATMRAIAVYNQIADQSNGVLAPLAPMYGDRYRVEIEQPVPVTVEQEVTTSYHVVDMSIPLTDLNGRRIETYTDPNGYAIARARVVELNDQTNRSWLMSALEGLNFPAGVGGEGGIYALQEATDWFFAHSEKGWGDVVTQDEFNDVAPLIWPDVLAPAIPAKDGGSGGNGTPITPPQG